MRLKFAYSALLPVAVAFQPPAFRHFASAASASAASTSSSSSSKTILSSTSFLVLVCSRKSKKADPPPQPLLLGGVGLLEAPRLDPGVDQLGQRAVPPHHARGEHRSALGRALPQGHLTDGQAGRGRDRAPPERRRRAALH